MIFCLITHGITKEVLAKVKCLLTERSSPSHHLLKVIALFEYTHNRLTNTHTACQHHRQTDILWGKPNTNTEK